MLINPTTTSTNVYYVYNY